MDESIIGQVAKVVFLVGVLCLSAYFLYSDERLMRERFAEQQVSAKSETVVQKTKKPKKANKRKEIGGSGGGEEEAAIAKLTEKLKGIVSKKEGFEGVVSSSSLNNNGVTQTDTSTLAPSPASTSHTPAPAQSK